MIAVYIMIRFNLNARLNILNKYFDKFVICESKYSHSGRKKKAKF